MTFTFKDTDKESTKILKQIFSPVFKNNNKDVWKKALNSIDNIIYKHFLNQEIKKKFIWQAVRYKLIQKFKAKFIKIS